MKSKLMFMGMIPQIQIKGSQKVNKVVPVWRKILIENNKYSPLFGKKTRTEQYLEEMRKELENTNE